MGIDPGNDLHGRDSKVTSTDVAIALLPERSESLWVGGMHMHNVPMALVREIIRHGKRFETLYAAPSASMAADLLIGAGLVDRVVLGYAGFEHIGLAPALRRAAESNGQVDIIEADSGSLVLALQSGAYGQPFAVLPDGLQRTDLPASSPDWYRTVADPFSGEERLAVAAVRPSVALIHCQQADEYGNGVFKGSVFTDRLLAFAAQRVIMQVEQLVGNNQIIKYPQQTGIPAFLVHSVVPVNFGCHPTASHRFYNYDDVHIRLYLKAAATEEGFAEYMRHFVTQAESQEEYMRRVQNQDWGAVQEEARG
ncbi:MAG TPA: CoA-transferase [Chloroflexia bacterium]|nr:CoA-transferase [Chloroflexia bacterium]